MELYVGGLPYSTTESQLEEIFLAHGAVGSARVITGRFTGQSRGFGFVEMSGESEAQKAIEALNGIELKGRTLVVDEARPRMIRKILSPTDLSSQSKAGMAYAISLASENSAELVFLVVTSMPIVQLAFLYQREFNRNRSVPESLVNHFLAKKRSQLDRFVRYHFGSELRQLPWRAEARWGVAASGIVRVAAEEDIDLIVVAKKKRGMMSLFSCSISESISRRSSCPVASIGSPLKGSPWRGRPLPDSGGAEQFS